ncbi:MAG: DUF485 domain-containing protein [Actinomycetota bacterium]|nr:DUF485 domain-containing protein [Actinomycetota bacterium]
MDEALGQSDTNDGSPPRSSGRVLLATDGSLPSVAATLRAIELGRERGAELHAVHAITPESDLQVEFGEASLAALDVQPVDGLEAARYLSSRAGVPAQLHRVRGPVVESILETARRIGAETIVMGETALPRAPRRTGIGTVAEMVQMDRSEKEVIVVPGRAADVVPVLKEIFASDPDALPGAASLDPDVDWAAVVREPSFRELMSAKTRFIVSVTVSALTFYLGVNVLAGFAPGFMSQRVVGALNVGYVLILALYVMTWAIALIYVRVANRTFDSKAADAIASLEKRRRVR